MTRTLNGRELADFIKQRQVRQVRNLRQEHRIVPKLVIVKSINASDVINTYVRLKQAYANDIWVEIDIVSCRQDEMAQEIANLNQDALVHGIVVQLPLDDPGKTDGIVGLIAPEKDVDGLGAQAAFHSATAEAIDWLLAGYNVELDGKYIAVIGRGRLVGAPLEKMWRERGYEVVCYDKGSDMAGVAGADVIVTATGSPRVLTSGMVKPGAVVVDAGTASESGVIVGDIEPGLRQRNDVTVTPEKGGVGPLTVAVMFDHVIQAALKVAGKL